MYFLSLKLLLASLAELISELMEESLDSLPEIEARAEDRRRREVDGEIISVGGLGSTWEIEEEEEEEVEDGSGSSEKETWQS